jgi:hypothetical protein
MIYWISEDYVRDNLPVEYSLLSGNILPALQQAHFINARDILGDRLFDKINELIITNTIDDPENERFKFLLDQYLQNVVLYWTMVYMNVNLLAKYANRGVQSQQGEFSNNADLSVWRTLKNEFQDLATYYSQRAQQLNNSISIDHPKTQNGCVSKVHRTMAITFQLKIECTVGAQFNQSTAIKRGNLVGRIEATQAR